MRDDELRAAFDFVLRVPILHVSDEALGRAIHVREVHRVGSDAWKLRPIIRPGISALSFGHDFSDRSSAQSAGAELERLVKAIVQFVPRFSSDKLIDDPRIEIRRRAIQQRLNIVRRRLEQFPVSYCIVDLRRHACGISIAVPTFQGFARAPAMNIHEYQAKELLEKFGVATTRGKVASTPD